MEEEAQSITLLHFTNYFTAILVIQIPNLNKIYSISLTGQLSSAINIMFLNFSNETLTINNLNRNGYRFLLGLHAILFRHQFEIDSWQ